jgi:hypothetical protein
MSEARKSELSSSEAVNDVSREYEFNELRV